MKAMIIQRLWHKYDPDQPRAPAGTAEGGQWVVWSRTSKVAGMYNEANRAKCEAQYESDMFQCSFSTGYSRIACREQAQNRYTLCMKDVPIPDLIYCLG